MMPVIYPGTPFAPPEAMAVVLLTGARAPATLELVRHLAAAGHRVLVADSVPVHPCRRSRGVAASFPLPSPVEDFEGWLEALAWVIESEGVELLIPTCEEVFWVARGRKRLATAAHVLVPSFERLRTLHSKWDFIQHVRAAGLPVPETWLIEGPDDLRALGAAPDAPTRLALKPVFSRFATRVRAWDRRSPAPDLPATPGAPWVAQAWIDGQGICTWGLAHEGRLLAHAAYPVTFTAGRGACIAFEALPDPDVRAWVERIVGAWGLSGQVAFDLIRSPDGMLWPLECNPRTTSGVHLFARDGRLASALFGRVEEVVEPPAGSRAVLAFAMWLYGLPAALVRGRLWAWIRAMVLARDVVACWRDPWPAWDQVPTYLQFVRLGRRHRQPVAAAMTRDIEWNGQP